MALEEKVADLDDFFVSSEEMRLFDQLIASDMDLTSGGNASPDREGYFQGESLDHSLAESAGHMDSALFPEVDENKENLQPNRNPYLNQNVESLKQETEEYENTSTSWYRPNTPTSEDKTLAALHLKNEADDGNDQHFNPWICRICKKTFRHQYTLNRHLPTHTDERNYKCDTCGKAFRQMSTLSQHRAIHSNERPYACPICRKTFNRVSTLISHKKTHSDEKPHKCHLCGKAFHQKGNLRNHIFTHTNERPYKCNICGKGFNQMSNLVCHRSHSHAKDSSYECGQCPQVFAKRHRLRLHEEVVHGFRYPPRHDKYPSNYMDYPEYLDLHHMRMVIDAITTPRMKETVRRGHIPFALLETYNGQSMPVKLVPAPQGKLFLVPAAAHEIAQYSHCGPNKIQIKLPMVAKVLQTFDEGGRFQLKAEPIDDGDFPSRKTETVTKEEEGVELLSLN